MNWLRVFSNAKASHLAQGARPQRYTLDDRQRNALPAIAESETGVRVVAALCARALVAQSPRLQCVEVRA